MKASTSKSEKERLTREETTASSSLETSKSTVETLKTKITKIKTSQTTMKTECASNVKTFTSELEETRKVTKKLDEEAQTSITTLPGQANEETTTTGTTTTTGGIISGSATSNRTSSSTSSITKTSTSTLKSTSTSTTKTIVTTKTGGRVTHRGPTGSLPSVPAPGVGDISTKVVVVTERAKTLRVQCTRASRNLEIKKKAIEAAIKNLKTEIKER